MYDRELLVERLGTVLEALERIPRRFQGMSDSEDFRASVDGIDRMDAICMILIAAGEEFKKIDRQTEGTLFSRYPFDWRGAIGVRDVMAHGYFDVDTEELFNICRDDVPSLIEILRMMIKDIERGTA
jgi:uncharacterized protein with HEPN domain